jgi:hypothetical protein
MGSSWHTPPAGIAHYAKPAAPLLCHAKFQDKSGVRWSARESNIRNPASVKLKVTCHPAHPIGRGGDIVRTLGPWAEIGPCQGEGEKSFEVQNRAATPDRSKASHLNARVPQASRSVRCLVGSPLSFYSKNRPSSTNRDSARIFPSLRSNRTDNYSTSNPRAS